MDKKMREKTGKPLKKAEKLLTRGEMLVKKADRSNSKLADYDEKVRDPEIAAYKKMKKKGC